MKEANLSCPIWQRHRTFQPGAEEIAAHVTIQLAALTRQCGRHNVMDGWRVSATLPANAVGMGDKGH